MIDTREAGAGSYPSQSEPEKLKLYRFKCLCEVEIDVWSPDLSLAEACCTFTDCDDYDLKRV